jgi:hypothetical protein
MATGTALSVLRTMLKGELSADSDSDVAPGGDDVLNAQLANEQKWLAGRYDFSDLNIRTEFNLVAGTRYYNFPAGLELSRKITVECYWSNLWYSTEPGINLVNYNTLNPDLNQRLDPVIRWQKYRANASGAVQLEVWPIPATITKLRVTGQMILPALAADADTCALDDLLIVQWTAAKMLAKMKSSDAPAMLQMAQETLKRLLGADNSPSQVFSMGGNPRGALRGRDPSTIPTVAVNYTP